MLGTEACAWGMLDVPRHTLMSQKTPKTWYLCLCFKFVFLSRGYMLT